MLAPSREQEQNVPVSPSLEGGQIERPALGALFDRAAQQELATSQVVQQFMGAPRGTPRRMLWDELLDRQEPEKVLSRYGSRINWGPDGSERDAVVASLLDAAHAHRSALGVVATSYQHPSTTSMTEKVKSGNPPLAITFKPFNSVQMEAVRREQAEVNRSLGIVGSDLERMKKQGLDDTPEYRDLSKLYSDLRSRVIVTPEMEQIGRVRQEAHTQLGNETLELSAREETDLKRAGMLGVGALGTVTPYVEHFKGWQSAEHTLLTPKRMSEVALEADPFHEPSYHGKVVNGEIEHRNDLIAFVNARNRPHAAALSAPLMEAPAIKPGIQETLQKPMTSGERATFADSMEKAAKAGPPPPNVPISPLSMLDPKQPNIDQVLAGTSTLSPNGASAKTLAEANLRIENEVNKRITTQRVAMLATLTLSAAGTAAELAAFSTGMGSGDPLSKGVGLATVSLNTLSNASDHIAHARRDGETRKQELARKTITEVTRLSDNFTERASNGLKNLDSLKLSHKVSPAELHTVERVIRERLDTDVDINGTTMNQRWKSFSAQHSVALDRAVLTEMSQHSDPAVSKLGAQGLKALEIKETEMAGQSSEAIHKAFTDHFRQLTYRQEAGSIFDSTRQIREYAAKEEFNHAETKAIIHQTFRGTPEQKGEIAHRLMALGVSDEIAGHLREAGEEKVLDAYQVKWSVERDLKHSYAEFVSQAGEMAAPMAKWGLTPTALLDSPYGAQDKVSTHDLMAADTVRSMIRRDRSMIPAGWSAPDTGEGKVGIASMPGVGGSSGTAALLVGFRQGRGASVAEEAKIHFFESRKTQKMPDSPINIEERRFTINLTEHDLKRSVPDLANRIKELHRSGEGFRKNDGSPNDVGAVVGMDNRTAHAMARHILDSRTPAAQAQAAGLSGSLFHYPAPKTSYDPDAIARLRGDYQRAKDEIVRDYNLLSCRDFHDHLIFKPKQVDEDRVWHTIENTRDNPTMAYSQLLRAGSTHEPLGHEVLRKIQEDQIRVASASAPALALVP